MDVGAAHVPHGRPKEVAALRRVPTVPDRSRGGAGQPPAAPDLDFRLSAVARSFRLPGHEPFRRPCQVAEVRRSWPIRPLRRGRAGPARAHDGRRSRVKAKDLAMRSHRSGRLAAMLRRTATLRVCIARSCWRSPALRAAAAQASTTSSTTATPPPTSRMRPPTRPTLLRSRAQTPVRRRLSMHRWLPVRHPPATSLPVATSGFDGRAETRRTEHRVIARGERSPSSAA